MPGGTKPASGVAAIQEEQWRQQAKGWTLYHDAIHHQDGELQAAACCLLGGPSPSSGPPWAIKLREKHRDNAIERLIIAGALIAAELDRLYGKR